jgi:hypothetical protein
VDWYYKAAIVVSLIWATARALGIYGEQSRDLDLAFLFGFMVTLGGWAAVFMIIDRVAKFLGWKRQVEPRADGESAAAATDGGPAAPTAAVVTTRPTPNAGNRTRRSSRSGRR